MCNPTNVVLVSSTATNQPPSSLRKNFFYKNKQRNKKYKRFLGYLQSLDQHNKFSLIVLRWQSAPFISPLFGLLKNYHYTHNCVSQDFPHQTHISSLLHQSLPSTSHQHTYEQCWLHVEKAKHNRVHIEFWLLQVSLSTSLSHC